MRRRAKRGVAAGLRCVFAAWVAWALRAGRCSAKPAQPPAIAVRHMRESADNRELLQSTSIRSRPPSAFADSDSSDNWTRPALFRVCSCPMREDAALVCRRTFGAVRAHSIHRRRSAWPAASVQSPCGSAQTPPAATRPAAVGSPVRKTGPCWPRRWWPPGGAP